MPLPFQIRRQPYQVTQFLNRASGLDRVHVDAYSRFINKLLDFGIWNKFDGLYIFAAPTSAIGLLNLKSRSFPCTIAGTPTFTADRGFTGNGGGSNDAKLLTGFTPSTAGGRYTQDSAHLAARSLTAQAASASAGRIFGNASSATPRATMLVRALSDLFSGRVNNAANIGAANANSDGHFILNRSGAAALQIYRNNASLGTSVEASTAITDQALSFLFDATSTSFSTLQLASGSFGASLTAEEVAAYYGAETEYMRSVGAV